MDHAGALLGMQDPGFVRANCRALAEVIDAAAPDVLVDFWNPFAVAAARAAGVPVVSVLQADAHPRGRGFVWWKSPPPTPPPSPAAAVSRVLAELGLPGVTRLEELCPGDLTLVVGSPETDPLPAGTAATWVGFLLWEQEGARLPASVEALGQERPLVWVYSGTPRYGFGGRALDSAVVIEACIEALGGEPLDVVLSTGHHRLPPELPPLPANFVHLPYLPGLAMAARADLLVHHGGYGSCQTGLHAGKPAVILPTYSERESNARRLEALGAAARVEVRTRRGEKSVDAAALRAAVRRVLSSPGYAGRAAALGDSLRALGGAARAADLIEGFAAAHRRPAA
jgi:UDP:flavonoid glycosyltransferase YjiC (YdhE family)